jgi:DNA-directed RNA polymerase subunit H (RpoH/RPB5)
MALQGIDADFRIYDILCIWMKECKQYKMPEGYKDLSAEEFKKQIQTNNYIHIQCTSVDDEKTNIVFVSKLAEISSNVGLFRKMLRNIGIKPESEKIKVIVITKVPFSAGTLKGRQDFPNVSIINYLHREFACDKRKGPMCHTHRVMSDEEKAKLIDFANTQAKSFPGISIWDPQIIWLNAKLGDLIQITRIEDTPGGESTAYRHVTSRKYNMSKSKGSDLNLSEE